MYLMTNQQFASAQPAGFSLPAYPRETTWEPTKKCQNAGYNFLPQKKDGEERIPTGIFGVASPTRQICKQTTVVRVGESNI